MGSSQDESQSKEEDPITIEEITRIAQKKLPENVWNYYASGADEQTTVKRNGDIYDKLYIRGRTMIDVTHIDTSTTIFNKRYPIPIGMAPSAMQRLAGGEGELDVASAAQSLNLNMTLSSQSTTSLEDVMSVFPPSSSSTDSSASRPDFWFQIYLTQDPSKSEPLIKRAEKAGYTALVLTVDTPVLGNRINERKTPLALPSNLRLANLEKPGPKPKTKKPTANRLLMDARTAADAEEVISSAGGSTHSSALTWEHTIPWLRKTSRLKIILKGIMTAEDAVLAVEHGADAIVVSNHGGRQLDSAPSTLEALPEIAKAVGGKIPIIFDGGVRRGSDVFKAIALGADFVLVGRPVLWGLSYKGKEGVETVMNILEREFNRTMALAGVTEVAAIKKSCLSVARKDGFGLSRL